ncbi:MAG: hypothetical protein IEMM0002_1197 [bacterium]|nr:MAG: hypothetical protein IEMM0002_1197 [bacterium]
MEVMLVLTVSVALQFTAAYMSLKLIRVTGKQTVWALIAGTIFLMAVRQCITLYGLISGDMAHPPDISAELAALVISVLMVAGIAMIAPLFRSIVGSEKAMRISEEKYRSLFESSRDTVFISTLEGKLLDINEAGVDMFGYSKDELLSINIGRTYAHPDEREPFIRIMKTQGFVKDYELQLKRKDESIINVLITAAVRMDNDGQLVGFHGIIRDVTERKRLEEALVNIARGVPASTGDAFFRSLVKYLVYTLKVGCAGVGELVGKEKDRVKTIAACGDGDIIENIEYNIIDTPSEKVLHDKNLCNYPNDVQHEFPRDQFLKEKHAKSYVGIPLLDSTGNAIGILSVMDKKHLRNQRMVESMLQIFSVRASAEIERKRTDEALAEEKERLAVTLRSIGDGVITTDINGKVVLMNRVAEKLTGLNQEEVTGKLFQKVFYIIDESTCSPIENPIEKVVESGEIISMTHRTILLAKDGTGWAISASAAPIRGSDSKITGVVIVFSDITEKRRMERELQKSQKLESLGILAGGIAHDFNNLLTAIMGNISMAKLDIDEETETHEILDEAENAVKRTKDLTRQLLTFSRGGEPVKEIGNVSEIIRSTVNFALRGSKSISDMELSEALPLLEIDVGQISQVINNLVINADQSMPEGGVIRVRAASVILGADDALPLGEGRYIRISIQDEGVGISGENINRIFDPFFTNKKDGSGLGLATSYSIVGKHSGLITVESMPGKGSTFHVYLPESDRPLRLMDKKSEVLNGVGRVLMMDDEEVVRSVAGRILTRLGYTPSVANDGVEAVDKYKEALESGDPFDVVILDLTVPGGMGGLKALLELKKLDPNVKAIVSSGYSTDPVVADCKKHGFAGFIVKPYDVEQVSDVLQNVIMRN